MAKIHLVDNDATTVSLLKILLELDGHAVSTCSRPADVVRSVIEEAPDLVLMDVFLTGADGLDLLRQIRTMPEFAGLPIVMTSGMELSEECARSGANAFLLKPYTPEHLSQIMNDQLDHRTGPSGQGGAK
jgi:CheY-like chemotaxis protein